MGAFAAFSTLRPAAGALHRKQRAQRVRSSRVVARAAQPQTTSCSRRGAVLLPGLLLPALALQLNLEARAEEAVSAVAPGSSLVDAQGSTEVVREIAEPTWRDYIARDFRFSYPPNLKVIEEDIFAAQSSRPRSTLDVPVEQPLKAQLRSEDGRQLVSVIVRLASTIKPTFTQLTNISQWGDEREVARLLLPPGAAVSSYGSISIPQPPKETGTFRGAIARDPITLYRYEVVLPDQTQVSMTVGAQKGQVYVMGAATSRSQWEQVGDTLRRCAETFRLINR